MANNLEFPQATDVNINLFIKDENGVVVNITGDKFWFTAKKNLEQTDEEADIQVSQTSHKDPTAGETVIEISNSESDVDGDEEYYYDIRRLSAAGELTVIQYGKLYVIPKVTYSKV